MPYSILIIDDDEATHDVLGEYFQLAGYEVLHARDGAAGLQVLDELHPDLVLLDVNMPVMDGFRTMEFIAANRDQLPAPVLFLTSLDREHLKIKGLELGAEDYIVKPFRKGELLARVKAALRRSARYRREESTLEGDLAQLSLAELLQTLDIGRKTAEVTLPASGGRIAVAEGMIVGAQIREFQGLDALRRIFYREGGAFAVRFHPPAPELEPLSLPMNSVLLDVVTSNDELRRATDPIAAPGTPLQIHQTGVAEIDRFRELSPLAFGELLCGMRGDLKENAALIARALASSTITVSTEGRDP